MLHISVEEPWQPSVIIILVLSNPLNIIYNNISTASIIMGTCLLVELVLVNSISGSKI